MMVCMTNSLLMQCELLSIIGFKCSNDLQQIWQDREIWDVQ